MEGSIDNPPIIVRGAFWKTLLLLGGSIAFVVLGVVLLLIGGHVLIALATVIFFGVGVVVGIIRMFKPVFVELSPNGIRWFDWKIHDLAWPDFTEFHVAKVRSTKFVGFNLSSVCTKKLPLRWANRTVANIDGAFPTGLEIGPDALAVLIVKASAKWSS